MIWLSFLADLGAVAALLAVVAMTFKRVGGAGPWLLAAAGALDAFMILVFRVYALVHRPDYGSWGVDHTLMWLQLLDGLAMYLAGALVLVGCALLMPKARR